MPQRIVETLSKRLLDDFDLSPLVAAEIEFYLPGASTLADFLLLQNDIEHTLLLHNINAHALEKERGAEQYEIALKPQSSPYLAAQDCTRLRLLIKEIAARHRIEADFSAKPFADQPGSGLHIHLHLQDKAGHNVFFKEDDAYSDILLHAIGGLQAAMAESMPLFAPTRASYARFVASHNVPVTVSWGANNRTVSIRLPTKPAHNKHLEHRVAGADTDPELALAAILAGVHYGLAHKIKPGEQIFGDAALPMYGLPLLPKNLRNAVTELESGKILPVYFGKEWCQEYCRKLRERY